MKWMSLELPFYTQWHHTKMLNNNIIIRNVFRHSQVHKNKEVSEDSMVSFFFLSFNFFKLGTVDDQLQSLEALASRQLDLRKTKYNRIHLIPLEKQQPRYQEISTQPKTILFNFGSCLLQYNQLIKRSGK